MQAQNRTVEGEFIATCQRLSLFEDWRKAGFVSAGRTDRGVHARGQVIAFTTDAPDRAIATINLQLPPDLWCSAYAVVPEQFHPRYDAKSRTYRYFFSEVPKNGEMVRDPYHGWEIDVTKEAFAKRTFSKKNLKKTIIQAIE